MKFSRTVLLLALSFAGPGLQPAVSKTGVTSAPCRVGQQAPAIGFWTWAANARVKVFIVNAGFRPEDTSSLLNAINNWNSVSETTGSGVKLEYQGTTDHQLTCDNCLTILRGSVFDKTKRHLTGLNAFSTKHDQIISYASIEVDPVLTNSKAIADALAHELGHNFGLLDCYTCQKKSTVMNQFRSTNVPNDLSAPTSCDIAQVREAYNELRVRVRPSPPDRALMDEGEEPVDDDTPIIVPKPPVK